MFSAAEGEEKVYYYLKEAADCEKRAKKYRVEWWCLWFMFDPHCKVAEDWEEVAEMWRDNARYVADHMEPNHRWSKK